MDLVNNVNYSAPERSKLSNQVTTVEKTPLSIVMMNSVSRAVILGEHIETIVPVLWVYGLAPLKQ